MKSVALLTLLPCLALSASAGSFRDHLGLQMWSLRDTTKESTIKALDVAAGFGFTEVETAGTGSLSVADFTKELQARKLTVVAAHIGYEGMQKDPAKILADAKALGAKYAIIPSLPRPKTGFTVDDARRVAAEFNTWAKLAKAEGLQFGYHTHGFEFIAAPDGTTPFDVLVRETDPNLVVFEMDVFWVFHAGQDPLKLLQKYPNRWRLMHVKDIRKGAVTGLSTGGAPPTDKVAVGDGQIDWPVLLAEADRAGVVHYFIEDEGVQPLKDIPASVKYLQGLK
jgi:sugar phosphate isomerase/epimerase